MMAKRRFGRVRRLPSGRWQARYLGPDGIDGAAPQTFGSKGDAEVSDLRKSTGGMPSDLRLSIRHSLRKVLNLP
jgi:hypothetical protein